jgi:hypothetical protein
VIVHHGGVDTAHATIAIALQNARNESSATSLEQRSKGVGQMLFGIVKATAENFGPIDRGRPKDGQIGAKFLSATTLLGQAIVQESVGCRFITIIIVTVNHNFLTGRSKVMGLNTIL